MLINTSGISLSISSDGRTLAVGGYGDDGNIGSTWIFEFDGSSYQQLGDKLVGSGSVGSFVQQGKFFCHNKSTFHIFP